MITGGCGGSGGGGGGQDRFAPKYLVGNVLNGDSATAYSSNGFFYIPDPGDGSGIAAALLAASALAADVWIRPGLYDLGAGAVVTPLTVPPACRVQGAGVGATRIRAKAVGDQGVFVLPSVLGGNPGAQSIRDMTIEAPAASGAGTGSESIILVETSGAMLNGLSIVYATDAQSTLRNGILVNTNLAASLPPSSIESVSLSISGSTTPSPTSAIKVTEGQVSARNVTVVGGDVGFDVQPQIVDPASQASVQIEESTFSLVDLGVYFGPGTIDSSVSHSDFGSPEGQTAVTVRRAVFVFTNVSGDVSGISIASNTIHVADYDGSGADTYAVRVNGGIDVVIEGNTIIHDEQNDAVSSSSAIFVGGVQERDIVIAGNTIRTSSNVSAIGFSSTVQRAAIASNTIECPEIWTPYGILLGGEGGPTDVTVTGNVVDVQASVQNGAGIYMNTNRCTATGNRVLPSGQGTGPAILVDGNENTVASNACSLAIPPGASTIVLTAGANNNVVLGNVCRTVPPVDNTAGGIGNEVAHNI